MTNDTLAKLAAIALEASGAGTDHRYANVELREDEWRLIHAALAAAEPMELALCESQRLVLREGVTYRFVKVGDCETCAAMSAASLDAYGAPQAAQQAARAPEGWVLVPLEPTDEMVEAANYQVFNKHLLRDAIRRAIAARPQAEGSPK